MAQQNHVRPSLGINQRPEYKYDLISVVNYYINKIQINNKLDVREKNMYQRFGFEIEESIKAMSALHFR